MHDPKRGLLTVGRLTYSMGVPRYSPLRCNHPRASMCFSELNSGCSLLWHRIQLLNGWLVRAARYYGVCASALIEIEYVCSSTDGSDRNWRVLLCQPSTPEKRHDVQVAVLEVAHND